MSPPLQPREHYVRSVAPFLQSESELARGYDADRAADADAGSNKLPSELSTLLREFRGLALQRGLPLPEPGETLYEHLEESDRGRTCRLIGQICTVLGCAVGAGITVATVNVGGYAIPIGLVTVGIAYAFTVLVGGILRLAFNAYPNNPECVVALRRIAAGAGVVGAVSLGSVMYLRFAEDPATLGWLSVALLGFEGSLLLAGATLVTMARVYLWSTRLVREFAKVTARMTAQQRKLAYEHETYRKDL